MSKIDSAIVTVEQQTRLQIIRNLRARTDRLEKELFRIWKDSNHDTDLLTDSLDASKELAKLEQEYRSIYRKDPE